MSCVICDLLGADKISLTAPGNEGGVDFFARISFPQKLSSSRSGLGKRALICTAPVVALTTPLTVSMRPFSFFIWN